MEQKLVRYGESLYMSKGLDMYLIFQTPLPLENSLGTVYLLQESSPQTKYQ